MNELTPESKAVLKAISDMMNMPTTEERFNAQQLPALIKAAEDNLTAQIEQAAQQAEAQ